MALKRSIVVAVPKVSHPTNIEEDLRPISLTSQIAKVMEDCTLDKLFPQTVDKLHTKQFAFPKLNPRFSQPWCRARHYTLD